ncbi:hypothetical protein [Haloferula sp. BvORR071]|uniref:hypothetical protein n=1 Tax=Haloferula sp. BvORR071 TaxID=1396141 RepID=UPI000552C1F1|nr:hypothetical protein [Haloferula sp. BvORR071]
MDSATPSPPEKKSGTGAAEFDLVRGDPWFRLEQRLHILPSNGRDGVLRRIVIFTTLAWVPLVLWAWATNHLFYSATGEPLRSTSGSTPAFSSPCRS